MDSEPTARERFAQSEQISLITSRLEDNRPDFDDIRALEKACLQSSKWRPKPGAILFHPVKVSSRFYTLLHAGLGFLLAGIRVADVAVSLGLPYRHYFFGKTFPYFTFGSNLRVLWI